MDCSPPGSSIHGILQARILEWVAYPFSSGSSQPRNRTRVSWTAGRFFTSWATMEAHIKPVNPKGNQSWMFIGRTDAKAETPTLWLPDAKSWLVGKTLLLAKIEGRRRRGRQTMPFNHLIFCHPLLLLLQSCPTSGSFPVSHLFTSGGQSIGVSSSTSVLSMNIQDYSPLGWTGWISL